MGMWTRVATYSLKWIAAAKCANGIPGPLPRFRYRSDRARLPLSKLFGSSAMAGSRIDKKTTSTPATAPFTSGAVTPSLSAKYRMLSSPLELATRISRFAALSFRAIVPSIFQIPMMSIFISCTCSQVAVNGQSQCVRFKRIRDNTVQSALAFRDKSASVTPWTFAATVRTAVCLRARAMRETSAKSGVASIYWREAYQ